jgi:hypothetical protein
MPISDIASLVSLLLALAALYVSWRAFKRSADAHVVNIGVEIYTPKEFPATPFDHKYPFLIIRNRSLFSVQIEDIGIIVNGQKIPSLTEVLPEGTPDFPHLLTAKEALHLEIPDEDLEVAIDKGFEVYVKTGCGQEFHPPSDHIARLATYIQTKLKEQVSLRKQAMNS